jgi:NAD(P)-dependent dehydrogenase (short-subunit alcohol dehydrogenase family)
VSESQHGSKRNLLILGVTSSLAPSILRSAKARGYNIYGTYRNRINVSPDFEDLVTLHELDISSEASISSFASFIQTAQFDTVVSLIGKTFIDKNIHAKSASVVLYLNSYITNLICLFDKIISSLENTQKKCSFTYVSSRAAIYGSFDPYYAATKSALQAYVTSLSSKYPQITFHLIISGLIEESTMFREMDLVNVENHRSRAENQLAHINDFGNFLFSAIESEKSELIHWFGKNY